MPTLIYSIDKGDVLIGTWPDAATAMRVGDGLELGGEELVVDSVTHSINPLGFRTVLRVRKKWPAEPKREPATDDPLKAYADKDGYVLKQIASYVGEYGFMSPPGSPARMRAVALLERLRKCQAEGRHVCRSSPEADHCEICGEPMILAGRVCPTSIPIVADSFVPTGEIHARQDGKTVAKAQWPREYKNHEVCRSCWGTLLGPGELEARKPGRCARCGGHVACPHGPLDCRRSAAPSAAATA